MSAPEPLRERELVSYLTLRVSIGFIGIALPFCLVVLCALYGDAPAVRPTISEYYDSVARDVFVGVLCTISAFLFSYRGYDDRDDWAADLGGVFSLGVALFPTTSENAWVRFGHLGCALCMFAVLAYFSMFLFTRTNPNKEPTRQKLMRNRVYRVCAVVILLAIVASLGFWPFLSTTPLSRLKPLFWFEAAALVAFGVAWTVKGELVLRDAVHGLGSGA